MATTNWNYDASHSHVGFKVRHLMITNVKGEFSNCSATVTTEDDQFESAKIKFSAEVSSITTGSEQRDGHLKGTDFFDADQFPAIEFESDGMTKNGKSSYTINGKLTIKGITKDVEVIAVASDMVKDPWGQIKIGFELTAIINRGDYGLVWNAPLEAGGMLLSDDVYINAEVQFVKEHN